MASSVDPLTQLHDIHIPADIGWWPLAVGWYLLALGIFLFLGAAVFFYPTILFAYAPPPTSLKFIIELRTSL